MMLIRADPQTKTISLLSFPRDLSVPIYCPAAASGRRRTGSTPPTRAAARKGTLETVRQLTGIPINYLITVNFHGFKQIVDQLGGVWMDVDRRYYNKNNGRRTTNFADINLQPGYQRLSGDAGARVRPLPAHRLGLLPARAPAGVRARVQGAGRVANFDVRDLPSIVSAITRQRRGRRDRTAATRTVLRYALFAATLPGGHFFQVEDRTAVSGYADLHALRTGAIQTPSRSSRTPTSASSKSRTRRARPEAQDEDAAAANDHDHRPERQRRRRRRRERRATACPARLHDAAAAGNAAPNSPTQTFHTKIYYDPRRRGAKAAARRSQKLLSSPPTSSRLPQIRPCARSTRARCFSSSSARPSTARLPPRRSTCAEAPAAVRRSDARDPGRDLLRAASQRVPFPLDGPDGPRASSVPDTTRGDTPSRIYWIDEGHKAVRLVFRTGGSGEYWGIEQTNWTDAPVLADQSFTPRLGGRDVRPLLRRRRTCTWSCCARRGELLGREHAARLALERDDARDRQGPASRSRRVK